MKRSSYTNLFVLLVVMIIVAVSGYNLRPHGPMDFAGGTQVVLADYSGSDTTGHRLESREPTWWRAANISHAPPTASAAYRTARHASCGGGQAFKRAGRHALFDKHHAGSGR